MVKGLTAEWGKCSRTVSLEHPPQGLSYWGNTIAVGFDRNIIILSAVTGRQMAILSGNTDCVQSVTHSPDGVFLVSGSYDSTVKLWDVQTGGVVKTFHGHTNVVWSVSVSADCTRIASGSSDNTIRLWDIQMGECCCIISQEDFVNNVSFFPTDPQNLLSICNFKVWQWDTDGHQIRPTYDGSYAALSPDGTQLVLCNEMTIKVQNSSSGVIITEFPMADNSIQTCCFSSDNRLLAAADCNTIYIWDISTSGTHPIETIVCSEGIDHLVFSSPLSLISTSHNQSVRFWQIGPQQNPVTAHPKSTFPTLYEIGSITLQAKDGIIITCDFQGVVKTWDILTSLCKTSFQTPATLCMLDVDDYGGGFLLGDGMVSNNQAVQLINDKLIVIWCENQRINAWDAESRELLFAVDELSGLRHLKTSGDGSRVFCLYEGFIQALSVQTGEIVNTVIVNSLNYRFLTVDGTRVWAHELNLEHQGWDFGTPGSSPVELLNIPANKLHPNGVMMWDTCLSRVKDAVTGKVVFQLPRRYRMPVDVQWNGKYLVACFFPVEVLILDFGHILL